MKRRKRALSGTTNDDEGFETDVDDINFNQSIVAQTNATDTKKNDSLSDNISLFQAIHVLQSKEDEDDDDETKNSTKAGKNLLVGYNDIFHILIHSFYII